MIRVFPEGGSLIRLAYRELNIAANGTKEQIKAIGDPRLLPGPGTRPPAAMPSLATGLGLALSLIHI